MNPNEDTVAEGEQREDTPGFEPDPVPRKDLTLPAKRLAGNPACLNCGTGLVGPFCHYCGQPDRNLLRFFPVLLRELLADFLDFDSRFVRTMKPLLFRPGKLTRDYLEGRRFRYTPPLRLYVFSSIAFFFLAALLARDAIQIGGVEVDPETADITLRGSPDADAALEHIDPITRAQIKKALQEAREEKEQMEEDAGDEEAASTNPIEINGKPWDRETNPFIVAWLPDWVNDRINDEIERSPEKGKQIEANPDLMKDKVFDVLPLTMFVLLPLFALLMKFWYLFAKKYYVEHLIYALHNHSFLFVLAVIIMLLGLLQSVVEPDGAGRFTPTIDVVTIILWCWMPVYLLLSMKRVYQQGWGMTLTKFALVGISYSVLLGLATGFVALLSFVLL